MASQSTGTSTQVEGTNVSYTAPSALAARYGLSGEHAAALAGVEPLTNALIESQ